MINILHFISFSSLYYTSTRLLPPPLVGSCLDFYRAPLWEIIPFNFCIRFRCTHFCGFLRYERTGTAVCLGVDDSSRLYGM